MLAWTYLQRRSRPKWWAPCSSIHRRLHRPAPSILVIATYAASLWLTALALKQLEISLAYAVWAGVGTAAVAVIGMAALGESVNALKLASIALVIGGVVGLNLSGANKLSPMAEVATASRREQIIEAALRVIGRSGTPGRHPPAPSPRRRACRSARRPTTSIPETTCCGRRSSTSRRVRSIATRELGDELRLVKSARELADRLIDELVEAVQDRIAYIAEYELWLEAGRRPELREAAQSWCDAEQRSVAGGMEAVGSTDPPADASLVVAALDGLGERAPGPRGRSGPRPRSSGPSCVG